MIDVKLEGVEHLRRRLLSLQKKAGTKVARGATTAGARVLRKGVKAVTPKDFGALQKSLTQRVKQYPASGVFVGVVGPQKGAAYAAGYKTPWGMTFTRTAIPERYEHLVLFGHRIVIGGTLSRERSKAGGGRRTTRRSEEQKRAEGRSGSLRRRTGVATAAQKARTGAGRIVGTVPPHDFLGRGMKRANRAALSAFLANMKAGVERAWNTAS